MRFWRLTNQPFYLINLVFRAFLGRYKNEGTHVASELRFLSVLGEEGLDDSLFQGLPKNQNTYYLRG